MKEQLWLNWTNRGMNLINFDLFGSFGLDFFSDDEFLLTETELTEQTETTEPTDQTEIGQLNNEDIDNFIAENPKTRLRRRKVTLTYFTGGQKVLKKRELLKTYRSKNSTNF